jgi:tetratricopeptide (TPR) repeat protein
VDIDIKLLVAALLALVLGACTVAELRQMHFSDYRPTAVSQKIDAAVVIEASALSKFYEPNLDEAIRQVMAEDLATLFTKPSFEKKGGEEFVLRTSLQATGQVFDITATLLDAKTGEVLASHSRRSDKSGSLKARLQSAVAPLKEDLAKTFDQPRLRAKRGQAPVEVGGLLGEARKAQREGNYTVALAALRRAIQGDPKSPATYGGASDLLLHLCDPDGAISVVEEGLKLSPNHPELQHWLGLAHGQKGDVNRARESRGGLGYLGVGLYMEANEVAIREVLPDTPAVKADLRPGDRILQVGGASVQDVQQVIALTRRAEPGSRLAFRLRRGEQVSDSTVTVGSVFDHRPPPYPAACRAQALNREGVALAREQKFAAALAKLEEAVRIAPGLIPKAHYNAALIHEQTGRPREALTHYVVAHQAFLLPQGQTETLSRMVALVQRAGITVPETADRRYRVGILRAQQKRYKEAIEEFEAALAEAPWLVDAYHNLGLVYDFTGAYQDALRTFRTYVQLAPTAPNIGTVKTKIVELEDRLGLLK